MSNVFRRRCLCCLFAVCPALVFAEPIPAEEAVAVDTRPLTVEEVLADPQLVWIGWSPVNEHGRQQGRRPVLLTHVVNGLDRVFTGMQRGEIHAFQNHEQAQATQIFLGLCDKLRYAPQQNQALPGTHA